MPMHDWTRVSAGTCHDFHGAWITHLKETLNGGLLPPSYYALGEQRTGDIHPDVLALRFEDPAAPLDSTVDDRSGLIAVAEKPPQVQVSQQAEDFAFQALKQRTVVIRHVTGDRVVAMVEIVSPANKHTQHALDDFVDKAITALSAGVHLLIIDPFPPSRHDPEGIHGAIWSRLWAGDFQLPRDRPLTLVAYSASSPLRAYVEPIHVGCALGAMPLFLAPDHYVNVPLEDTYQQAWTGVPDRWRRVIEA